MRNSVEGWESKEFIEGTGWREFRRIVWGLCHVQVHKVEMWEKEPKFNLKLSRCEVNPKEDWRVQGKKYNHKAYGNAKVVKRSEDVLTEKVWSHHTRVLRW